jgi:hypothetical protein
MNEHIVLIEPVEVNSISLTHLCRSSGPSLSTPQLRRLLLLRGFLALADGGGAGNGLAAEIWAVAALGGAIDDGGVGPAESFSLRPHISLHLDQTYLRVERLAGMVDFWTCEAGELALSAFLVRSVTPPSSPG